MECEVQALGTNDHADLGALTTWNLSSVALRSYGTLLEVSSLQAEKLKTSVEGGDSGGALMCTRAGHDPELIAIVGGYHYNDSDPESRISDYFTPVWLDSMKFIQGSIP